MRKPIFWILLLAFFLRLWGITYGFPLFLINDETPHVYGALKMIELRTLIPAFHQEEFKKVLYYPPLLSYFYLLTLSPVIAVHYLLSGAPPLVDYKAMLALDPSFIWIAARIWMALIGVADILIVYLLARRMFQAERPAILAAIFLALSFWHIQLSHNARHWLPAAILLSLLWYLAYRAASGQTPLKTYIFSGFIAGLAAGGVNTAAAVGLTPLLFAHLFREDSFWKKIFSKDLALFLLVFLATALLFVTLYPFGITRAEGAPGPAADLAGRLAGLAQKNFTDWLRFLLAYIRTFWNFETPLFLAALAGLGLFWTKGRRRWILAVISYALAFFSLLYLFDDFTSRGVIFVLPIMAVFAGYAADQMFEKFRNFEIKKLSMMSMRIGAFNSSVSSFLISIFFFVALFGWQLVTDFRYDWLLSKKDTRLVARDWISRNVPAGSKIIMDSQYLRLNNTKEGIREIQEIDPSALRAADFAILNLPFERLPQPSYRALNLNFISPYIRENAVFRSEFAVQRRFSYLVVEYASSAAIKEDTRRLMTDAKLIKHFSGRKTPGGAAYDGSGKINGISIAKLFALERFGLFVDIYELR